MRRIRPRGVVTFPVPLPLTKPICTADGLEERLQKATGVLDISICPHKVIHHPSPTLLCVQEADLNGSLASDFQLVSANGDHGQEIRGREESDPKVFIPLTPVRLGCLGLVVSPD